MARVTIDIVTTGADQTQAAFQKLEQAFRAAGVQTGVLGQALAALSSPLGAVGAALTVMGAAATAGVAAIAKNAAEVRNLMAVSGLGAEAADNLADAFSLVGVESGVLTQALFKMGSEIESGGEGLQRLGVSLRDSQGLLKSEGQLFLDVLDKVQGLGDAFARSAALQDIFGKGARELAVVGNLNREAFAKLLEEARKYSDWTERQQAIGQDFLVAQNRVQLALSGIAQVIGTALVPELTNAANAFASWLVAVRGSDALADVAESVVILARAFGDLGSALGAMGSSLGAVFAPLEGILGPAQSLADTVHATANEIKALSDMLAIGLNAALSAVAGPLAYFGSLLADVANSQLPNFTRAAQAAALAQAEAQTRLAESVVKFQDDMIAMRRDSGLAWREGTVNVTGFGTAMEETGKKAGGTGGALRQTASEMQKMAAEAKAVQTVLDGMQKRMLDLAIPDSVARSLVALRMETEKEIALHPQAAAAIRLQAKAIEDMTVQAAIAKRELEALGEALVLVGDEAIADLLNDTVTSLTFMATSSEEAAAAIAFLGDSVEELVAQAEALDKLSFEYVPPDEAATQVAFMTDSVRALVAEAQILEGMTFEYVPKEEQMAAWAFAADSVADFVAEARRAESELADQKLFTAIESGFLSVTDTFTKMATGLIQGTLDIGAAFTNLGQSLLANFAQMVIHKVFDPILSAAASFMVGLIKILFGGSGAASFAQGAASWGSSLLGGLFGGGAGPGSAAAGLAGDIAFANAPGGLGLGGGGGGGSALDIGGSALSGATTAYAGLSWLFPQTFPSLSSLLPTSAQLFGPASYSTAQVGAMMGFGPAAPSLFGPASYSAAEVAALMGGGGPAAAEAAGVVGGGAAGGELGFTLASGTFTPLGALALPLATLMIPLFFGALDAPDPETVWKNVQRERAAAGYTGDVMARQAQLAAGGLGLQEPNVRMDLAIVGGVAELHRSALEAQLADGLAVGMEDVYRSKIGDMTTFLDQLAEIGIEPATGDLTQFGENIKNVGEAIDLTFRDQIIAEYSRILKSMPEKKGAAAAAGGEDFIAIGVDDAQIAAALVKTKVTFITSVNAMKDVAEQLGLSVDRTHVSFKDIEGSTAGELQEFAKDFQKQMVDEFMKAPPETWAKTAKFFDLAKLQKGSETFQQTGERVAQSLFGLGTMMHTLGTEARTLRGELPTAEDVMGDVTRLTTDVNHALSDLASDDPTDTLNAAVRAHTAILAAYQAQIVPIQQYVERINTQTAGVTGGAVALAKWAGPLQAVGVDLGAVAGDMARFSATLPTTQSRLTALSGATALFGARLQAAQSGAAVRGVIADAQPLLDSFVSAFEHIQQLDDPAARVAALSALLDQLGGSAAAAMGAIQAAMDRIRGAIAQSAQAVAQQAPLLITAGVNVGAMTAGMIAFSATMPDLTSRVGMLTSAMQLFSASAMVAAKTRDPAQVQQAISNALALFASLQEAAAAAQLIKDPAERLLRLNEVMGLVAAGTETAIAAVQAFYGAIIAETQRLMNQINTIASSVAKAGDILAKNADWLVKIGVDFRALTLDMTAFSKSLLTVQGTLTAVGSAIRLFGAGIGVGQIKPLEVLPLVTQYAGLRGGPTDVGPILAQINEGLGGIPFAMADAYTKAMALSDPGERLEALGVIIEDVGAFLDLLPPEMADAIVTAFAPELQTLVGAYRATAAEQAAAAAAARAQLQTLMKDSGALSPENFLQMNVKAMADAMNLIIEGAGPLLRSVGDALTEAVRAAGVEFTLLKGSMDTLVSVIAPFAATVATALKDAATTLAQAVGDASRSLGTIISGFGTIVDNVPAAIASAVASALSGLAASIGSAVSSTLASYFPPLAGGTDMVPGGLAVLHPGEMVLNPKAAATARGLGLTNQTLSSVPSFALGIDAIPPGVLAGAYAGAAGVPSIVDKLLTQGVTQGYGFASANMAAVAPVPPPGVAVAPKDTQQALEDLIDALEDTQDALEKSIDEWGRVVESVRDLRESLLTGQLSPLNPADQFAFIESQLAEAVGAFRTGPTPEGAERIEDLIGKRLEAAADLYTLPSNQYMAIFNDSMGLLDEIATVADTRLAADTVELQKVNAELEKQTALLEQIKAVISGGGAAAAAAPTNFSGTSGPMGGAHYGGFAPWGPSPGGSGSPRGALPVVDALTKGLIDLLQVGREGGDIVASLDTYIAQVGELTGDNTAVALLRDIQAQFASGLIPDLSALMAHVGTYGEIAAPILDALKAIEQYLASIPHAQHGMLTGGGGLVLTHPRERILSAVETAAYRGGGAAERYQFSVGNITVHGGDARSARAIADEILEQWKQGIDGRGRHQDIRERIRKATRYR